MNSNTTGEINPEIIQERLYSPDTTRRDATRRDGRLRRRTGLEPNSCLPSQLIIQARRLEPNWTELR